MKRILLMAAAAAVAMPVIGFTPAQVAGQRAAVTKALSAAPARNRDDATVISWNSDYTYETLKEGTNQLVCYDRSSESRRAAFDVQCTNLGNLDRVAQNRRFRAESADRAAENALIEAAEAAGTRAEAVFGSLWIAMRGDDQASARTHTTIAMPFATTATTGFPENGRSGGAYIMGAGTAGAHLMTPGS
jgi:hypothetical protein